MVKATDKEWIPTKLIHADKNMKLKSLPSVPIKESEIIGFFLWVSLQDEILNITPVQKKIRFNAFVAKEITRFTLNIMCFKEVIISMWRIVTLTKFSMSLCKG